MGWRLTSSRRAVYLFSTGVVIFVFTLFLLAPEFLKAIEAKLYDLHFTLRGVRNPGDQVVIVAIDEKSLAAIGRWPWPRSVLADLVRKLSEAEAKVIALDILLSEPEVSGELHVAARLSERFSTLGLSTVGAAGRAFQRELDVLSRKSDHDGQMEDALRESARVVLPIVFEIKSETRDSPPEPSGQPLKSALVGFRHYSERGLYPPPSAINATLPIPRLAAAARELGHVTMLADSDGSTRWEALVFEHRGYYYPSLGVQAVRLALGVEVTRLTLDFGQALEVGPLMIPVDPRNRMLVDYAGPERTFRHLSAVDLLADKVPKEALRDRIVFVGATAVGVYDLRVTPMSPVLSGAEKHANVAANILNGRFLRRPDWVELVEAAGILFWPTFLAWLLPRLRPVVSLGAVLILWGAFFGAVHLAFLWGLWIPLVYPSLALFLSPMAILGYLYFTEERQRVWIKRAFQRFVSPEVVERIAENPAALQFGGEIRTLTVLFADIRDFTGYTERYPPQDVVQMLREYFTRMVDQILAHQGTLDKFIGDTIMAIFGAPLPLPDHAERACRAGVAMLAELEKLQAKWTAEGREPFRIGIGINTGEMVVGNLGSEQLFEYTVVGDGVNVAARLEGLTKVFATPMIISESTYHEVRHLFFGRYLGEVKVKGKEVPVKIFAVEPGDGRKAHRVGLEARLTITEADVSVPGSITDLSLTGVGAKNVTRLFPKGQVVQLLLDLPDLPRPISAEGRVIWSEEDRAGIVFLGLPAEEKEILENFLGRRGQALTRTSVSAN